MGVARDDEPRAAIPGELRVDVVQVQPIDLTVDFERHAPRRGRVDDRGDVERIRLALQDPAPGRVAEDVDMRVLERAQQPVGHLLVILIERGVHRGDDEIERGEAVVGQVERAVRLDVAFDAGQQPDAGAFGIHGANASGVRERAALVEAVGHGERLAVIGDGDVLRAPPPAPRPPSRARRLCRRSRWCACGDRRADRRDRSGEAAPAPARLRFRRASRAAPAESSRVRAPRTRLPPRSPATRVSSSVLNTPYSFSLKPRPIARSRSAMLCAFEPVKYCMRGAAAFGRHESKIRLKPAPDEDARLGLAAPEDAFDERVADEVVHQRRLRAGGEQVEIAAGVASAPEAADRRDGRLRRALAEIRDERLGGVVRVGEEMAARVALAFLERLEDERLLLRAHAAQRADASIGRRVLEIGERPDAELAVQRRHGLGPDAVQVEEVEEWSAETRPAARDGRRRRPCRRSRGFSRPDPCRCRESPAGPLRRATRGDGDDWRRCRRRFDTRES